MKTRVLFVCMGNICRSPTAEGVFRVKAERMGVGRFLEIDSAGTHGYHTGEPPDPRAASFAARRGYDLTHLRARKVSGEDFERFEHILAMDVDNLAWLKSRAPTPHQYKARLFLEYARRTKLREVPDPYYGGDTGFETVLDLVEDAAEGLLEELRASGKFGAT